jgi:predicted permease
MNAIFNTFPTIIPVMMVIIAGALSKKYNLIKEQGIDGMRFFITNIALPAALFKAVGTIKMSIDVIISIGVISSSILIVMLIGFLLVKIFTKLNPMTPFLVTSFEAGMLGYPLFILLFGIDKLSSIAIFAVGNDLFVFTIYTALLKKKEGNVNLKILIKSMFSSPVFIAILLGLIFSSSNIYYSFENNILLTTIFSVLQFFSQPIACIMLFVIGYGISFSKNNINQVFIISLLRLILMGSMAFIVVNLLENIIGLDIYMRTAIILLFFTPAPYILPIFSKDMNNRVFTSTVLSANLITSMIAFSIIAYNISL